MAEPVNHDQVTEYADTAYRSDRIPVMPPPVQTQYENIIPHYPRLGWGNYQYLSPLLTFKFQLHYAKGHDNASEDEKGFPWNHQYLNESTGGMALLLTGLFYCKMGFFLLIWVHAAIAFFLFLSDLVSGNLLSADGWIQLARDIGIFVGLPVLGYLIFTPLHRWVSNRSYHQFKSDLTGYYRNDGMVRIRQKDGIFEAP